jgi:hypothetical protein
MHGFYDSDVFDFVSFVNHSRTRNCNNPSVVLKVPSCKSSTFQSSFFNRIYFIYLFSFACNYTIKTTRTPNHFCPTPKRENFNATYMISKLNLGWFNFRIVHIHLICLNFISPTLENMENCLKTWHRSRQNLSKRSKYAEPPTFQGWTKR